MQYIDWYPFMLFLILKNALWIPSLSILVIS